VLKFCHYCGTRLVPIGSSRANGAAHSDWSERKLHKKCLVEWKGNTYRLKLPTQVAQAYWTERNIRTDVRGTPVPGQ